MGAAADWQTTYHRLKRREIDMSACLAITPQRLEHLDFTDTYFTSQVVFFAREDMPYIRNISDLQGLRVAVVENYATDEWMSRDMPDLPLMRTNALEMLQSDQKNADTTYLRMARNGAQTATNMAQALLDICRLESGKMPLSRMAIDLKAVAEKAIRAMDLQARAVEVRLVLSGEAVRGEADPDILHRVLLNLIGNAVKASSCGASVEVLTIDGGSRMSVKVRDFGRGIPKAFHDVLFDKFTTVESCTRQRTSVGLGLTFCKMAIEAHGGYITVESEPGQGSTFCIHIPKRPPIDTAEQENSLRGLKGF